MITGFNTDIEYDGITYHVQTEDKGLSSPLILSLVYAGGTILASKRAAYDDLIADGFDESLLSDRVARQHKLVCAAILAGRIEDLKRMSEREAAVRSAARTAAKQNQTIETPSEPAIISVPTPVASPLPPKETIAPVVASDARTTYAVPETDDALRLRLLDEKEYHGGEQVTLKIRVERGTKGKEVVAADVIVKILGSAFRPVNFSAKTNEQGIATVSTQLPKFTTGRAAILVRATSFGLEAELRRIIQPK